MGIMTMKQGKERRFESIHRHFNAHPFAFKPINKQQTVTLGMLARHISYKNTGYYLLLLPIYIGCLQVMEYAAYRLPI